MDAKEVIGLVGRRHEGDIFVEELCCFDEESRRTLRMDGWAMKRGNNLVTGYEVKVSRQDFLHDDKWQLYLKLCNEFYFVCPWGLIKEDELDVNVGLLWVSNGGNRLYLKKPSVRRETNKEYLQKLLLSILWNRSKIVSSVYSEENKRSFFERWLKDRNLDRDFGRMVGKSIRQEIKKKISSVQKENDLCLQKIEYVNSAMSQVANYLGMDVSSDFLEVVKELKKMISEHRDHSNERAKELVKELLSIL